MNQEMLATRTGIERSHISHYETGRNTPTLPYLVKLAEVLDCSTEWLCGREDLPMAATIFGERLRLARIERGMTQEQLSERTGIAYQILSLYENGHRKPTLDPLVTMAQVLDCSLDWLCGLDD